MNALHQSNRPRVLAIIATTVVSLAAYSSVAFASDVMLSGDQEVPAVKTSASGGGKIMVNPDMTVSGSVTTKGVAGTAAHIHMGAMGKNGGVAVALTKSGDTYSVPAGAKLTADQYKAYQAGELYVNVHSEANKGGEIRGQIKP